MKTPEQWIGNAKQFLGETWLDWIKQIQLDAVKEGMSRAGRICEEQAIQYEEPMNSTVCKGCQKAIIEERNGLEKL